MPQYSLCSPLLYWVNITLSPAPSLNNHKVGDISVCESQTMHRDEWLCEWSSTPQARTLDAQRIQPRSINGWSHAGCSVMRSTRKSISVLTFSARRWVAGKTAEKLKDDSE